MESPFVMMCTQCRQVVSDSNQLLCAVADLDALVLDAVVGVRISEATEVGDSLFGKLSCSKCDAELGRIYRRTGQPALQHIVHQPSAPRYTLYRAALGSYVLGSAKEQHDAAQPDRDADARAREVPAIASQSVADPSAAADEVRVQLAQLMRVVLGLDQRLRAIEQGGGGLAVDELEEASAGQKRAR